ncbi:hypothetical protein LRP52_28865 [Photobacterium sp. ZSDE20]|uniref:Uncharacterized protein n=1 Tax=Photobacterium pectinilyticum TaxID=2906793 RepID=A0ABT1N8N2_9GAMM|nr:hypothetical protein [Photobacterium sp. ZSDE20]MCQ1061088.1 hypothetical protein [Photobacterium sp. ZSDE20]MDD1826193.1 hypothetical protein [Photobacterium sp. ZSDE20]
MIKPVLSAYEICSRCRRHQQTITSDDGKPVCPKCSYLKHLVDQYVICHSNNRWWLIAFDGRSEIYVEASADTYDGIVQLNGNEDAIALVL